MSEQGPQQKGWFSRVFGSEAEQRMQEMADAIEARDRMIAELQEEQESLRLAHTEMLSQVESRLVSSRREIEALTRRAKLAEAQVREAHVKLTEQEQAHREELLEAGRNAQVSVASERLQAKNAAEELTELQVRVRKESDARRRAEGEVQAAIQRLTAAERVAEQLKRDSAARVAELEAAGGVMSRDAERKARELEARVKSEQQRAEKEAARAKTEAARAEKEAARAQSEHDRAERGHAELARLQRAFAGAFGEHGEQALGLLTAVDPRSDG